MNNLKALARIRHNLSVGKAYGKYVYNVRFPYAHKQLYITPYGNIGWNNYGSSANANNVLGLLWIIKNIFDTTPEQFIKDYQVIL